MNVEYGIINMTTLGEKWRNSGENGWVFTPNETFKVCGFRSLTPSSDDGTTCNLWDLSTSTLLATAEITPTGEWVEVYLNSAVTLEVGKKYAVTKLCTHIYFYNDATSKTTFNSKLTYNTAVYSRPATGNAPMNEEENHMYPHIDIIIGEYSETEPDEPDFEPEHSTKYLIKSEDMLCTVIDNELVLLDQAELTAEVFHSHGFDELPDWSVISTLTNPEILYWQSADIEDELPTITATMTAMPYPQTIISQNYDMSDDTILGVECAYVTASSDVVFAISVDDGSSWYMWTGSAWGTLTDATTGMTAETINAITTEQWAGLMTTGQFKVRMTLFDENSSFTSFVMDYIN